MALESITKELIEAIQQQASTLMHVSNLYGSPQGEKLAQQIVDGEQGTIIGSLVTVAAAVVYILLVRGLTDRHSRLTGEAVTPA